MKEVTVTIIDQAVNVTLRDQQGPMLCPPRNLSFTTMAEAMVEVMEFLAPNQLHTVSAYLELKAAQDEKTSFQAVYGG